MGGGGKNLGSTTIGFRYYMSLMMGLSRGPINEIVEIRIGDKLAFPVDGQSTITGSGEYSIDAPYLFGGDKKEGGVQGTFTVAMGQPDQVISPWWKSLLGGAVPDFRGVTTAMFDGLLCSLNPYPKKWKMRLRRTDVGWDGEAWAPHLATIWMGGGTIRAMNPAHILYECLTNRQWGRGLARSRLNEAAWLAAAQTLFNEGLGLCIKWSRQTELREFIGVNLDHIGGGIYADRETGLLTLHLMRDGYDPEALPVFSYDSGLLSVEREDTAARDNAVNEIIVKYRSPLDDSEREVRVQNIASIQSLGAINSTTTDYSGAPTHELAARLAARDLRITSTANRRYKVKLDRRAWKMHPGSVFAISAPDKGIGRAILRAGKISDGTLVDGVITVDAVIDVFGLDATSFLTEPTQAWTPPSTAPMPIVHWTRREATYLDLVLRLSAADRALIDPLSGAIATLASKPNVMQQAYAVATKVGSEPFVERSTAGYVPSAKIAVAITAYQTTFDVNDLVEPGLVETGHLIEIEGEILRLISIAMNPDGVSASITVGRGCVDTVPAPHALNTRVFFNSRDAGTDSREYVSGETVDIKLLSTTSNGTLDIGSAETRSLTVAGRQGRPYPPGDVRLNGTLVFNVSAGSGTLKLTWKHRDRLLQQDQILDHTAASVGPEPGVTYELRTFSATNVLLHTATGITGTEVNLPANTGALRYELQAVRSGLASHQKIVFFLTRNT